MAKKIMVVDDSKVAQLQLQRILSDSPYEVISCCQNGEDAVEQYRVLKPDLITMDILMPGLDGLEAARKILEEDPDAKILMISSLAYDETIEESRNLGRRRASYISPSKRKMCCRLWIRSSLNNKKAHRKNLCAFFLTSPTG